MEMFSQDKPIYLQIADRICDEILSGKYADDMRIPSVRDYAAELQVNTNTAVKAYDELSRQEVIYQRRGMGYYVTAGAKSAIMKERRKAFLGKTLKEVFRQMNLLGISIEEVTTEYKKTLLLIVALFSIATLWAQDKNATDSIHKTVNLENVEIVAQKPLVKMKTDKVTYSVQDDADSKTMTLLDMLRKVPMVTVDGQDNITVNGSSSFKVYTNGKPNPMFSKNASQIFRSIPAAMVESVEVVTNPGAKYDAEGTSGILDIKFKNQPGGGGAAKAPDGYNANVELRGGNKGYGGSAFLSGQKKRWTYSANVAGGYEDNGDVDVSMNRKQNDGSTTEYTMTSRNKQPMYYGDFALGYEVDSMSTINASLGLFGWNEKNTGTPTTHLYGGVYGSGYSYSNSYYEKNSNISINGSLDYQRFFDKDRKNSLTLTYQISTEPGTKDNETKFPSLGSDLAILDSQQSAIYLYDRRSHGKENTTEHIGQADLTWKLSYHSALNTGLKYANRRSTAKNDYYIEDEYSELLSSDYVHNNNIGAVYAELDNNWSSWSVKGGLRYEHTWQNVEYRSGQGEDFRKNYGNIVPSANVSYSLAPGQNIGLAYNMRISRPGISYLNPYVDRSEPTSITYGNPELDVEKNHTISMVYNRYNPKLAVNATLKQQFIRGGIEEFSFYDEDNILNTTYGNIVNRRISSMDVFASYLPWKNTRITVKGGVSYSDFRSTELQQYNNGWAGNGMINIQQTLPKDMTISLMCFLNSKTYNLQGWNSGFNIGVLSMSKQFFKKRLTLSAYAVTGLSKGGRLHFDKYAESKDFTSQTNISLPITRFSITARWTFGNMDKKYEVRKSKVESDYIEHKSDNSGTGNVTMGQ